VLSVLSRFHRWSGRTFPALRRPRIQFLEMHHVLPEEVEPFRNLLIRLGQHHRFLTYSEAVERIWEGRFEEPSLVLSFDDGFRSSVQAARIMTDLGIRGCFFLCPSIIGERDEGRVRDYCLDRLRIAPMEFLSWDEVDALLRDGHEVGAHTMSHSELSRLSAGALTEEVVASREALERKVGEVRHFAWPFGFFRVFTPAAAKVVFDAGFLSCASAVRGAHATKRRGRQLCIRRDGILPGWPEGHVLYFLTRSSLRASRHGGGWPDGWSVTAGEGGESPG
jgi:peptidoglycan/xylan/chitin deacetylase (PgdA/CDA1 family)